MYLKKVIASVFALAIIVFSAGCSPVGDGILYEEAVSQTIEIADKAISTSTAVPMPADAVGGPVHQALSGHIQYLEACGYAYELTGDERYARWCGELLSNYAAIYGRLGYHPEGHNTGEPGRLFWQVLDDSRWAMYASRSYMKIKNALPGEQRRAIEDDLFRPMADFLMYGTEDNAKNNFVFNRMHNHGTWQVAAVGTIGFATGDDTLVGKALLGTDLSGRNGGFLQQIDSLFSPDGYYMEGVSYQRYALIPFLSFASLIDRNRPEIHIFERHSSALLKSADAMFNQAYDGTFFLLNDCDTKCYGSSDLVGPICTIYNMDPSRKWLLGIVVEHARKVTPDEAGRRVSRDIAAGLAEDFVPVSCKLRDGGSGKAGAVMVLRGTPEGAHDGPTVVMKACSQGSYHGHFDRLSLCYYDLGKPVLTDYGSARYTGVGQKEGGRYTKLNRGYAMTSVAHNTLVVDRASHYGGVTPYAILHAPRVIDFDGDASDGIQCMAAVDSTAYDGVRMERWVAMIDLPFLDRPLITDVVIASSDKSHSYDLPYHYDGQMMALNADYKRSTDKMTVAGKDFGYQHLWVEAEAEKQEGPARFTWLCGERMYTLSTAVSSSSGSCGISLLRTGAGDPDFVLRSEPAYMLSAEGSGRVVFASCLESHGHYRIQDEIYSGLAPSNTGVAVECGEAGVCVRYSFGGRGLELTIKDGSMSERVF